MSPPFTRLSIAALCVAASIAVGCGDPPDREMQQAQGAIDAARAAGASEYAHDEFAAAEEALKGAREAVDQRDYRLALNRALDSRERAETATKDAADSKAAARADADRALAAATAALDEAKIKLEAADDARVQPTLLTSARGAIAQSDATVQKARTAFEHGDYLRVSLELTGEAGRLQAVVRDLDAIALPAARRRR